MGNPGAGTTHDQSDTRIPSVAGRWETLLEPEQRGALEDVLPTYIHARRWFGGKTRTIKHVRVDEAIPVPYAGGTSYIAFLRIAYAEGADDTYVLPLACATGEQAHRIAQEHPHAVIGRLAAEDSRADGIVHDALMDHAFAQALLHAFTTHEHFGGHHGEVVASTTGAFEPPASPNALAPRVMGAEQSNTSVVFGNRLIMKLFRRLDTGINPDVEIGRFLTEQSSFANIPPVSGAIEYRPRDGEPMSLVILQGFVPNRGDAWQYTLDELAAYYQRVQGAQLPTPQDIALSTAKLLELSEEELPAEAEELIGDYAAAARLLGQRTAEMHLALATDTGDPQFTPEPFTVAYQQSLFDALSAQLHRIFGLLRTVMERLPADVQDNVRTVLAREAHALDRFRPVLDHAITAMRIRYHGDYHLGQVLYTGEDFYIIDFEGEPARPLSERRMKRSALQDVAGMLRSFHYASYAALLTQTDTQERTALDPWARAWHRWVSTLFLQSYRQTAGNAPFLPHDPEELHLLLDIYLLEKAVYELGYELNNRPDWVKIPLQGVMQLLAT